MKKYTITVLVGTVYEAEIEAEALDVALTLAYGRDPEVEGWKALEADRTVIIEHSHGRTAFGFGVETAILGWK
jgi:hypothetical protein